MKKGTQTAAYDEKLQLEAFHFQDFGRPFPNHFHPYYVLGVVERGRRRLSCKGQEYDLGPGCVVLFNPGDNHGCVQGDGGTFDYRGLHLTKELARHLTQEITGRAELPVFLTPVLEDPEISEMLLRLHQLVMDRSCSFAREETLFFLFEGLLQRCTQPGASVPDPLPHQKELEAACGFMEDHFAQRVSLDQVCRCAGVSSSTLLRAFTREKGVTPYRYLENIRIGEAKKLLEHGVSPAETALVAGFADQSHLTNSFRRFIGLSPGAYREIFTDQRGEETH